MAVKESAGGAAGEAAAVVAKQEGAADRGRDRAGAAAYVKDGVVPVDGGRDEAAVAGEAAERFRGNGGAVVQGSAERRVVGGEVAIQVHDDFGLRGGGGVGL